MDELQEIDDMVRKYTIEKRYICDITGEICGDSERGKQSRPDDYCNNCVIYRDWKNSSIKINWQKINRYWNKFLIQVGEKNPPYKHFERTEMRGPRKGKKAHVNRADQDKKMLRGEDYE